MIDISEKLTIKDASRWATKYLGKDVTPSNITYLINYGRIQKITEGGQLYVCRKELETYYKLYNAQRESKFTEKIGADLNWALSFANVKESETTKHVHRLHPYKGKFIPQLVEYFLDGHIDSFKKKVYFHKGDIVLDPFCGSGTTLVQANELGINAIGIDISQFNTLISNVKIFEYDRTLQIEIDKITQKILNHQLSSNIFQFEKEITCELSQFNDKYFPIPEYRLMIRSGKINEVEYGHQKESEFVLLYNYLVKRYNIELIQENPRTFIEKWYMKHIQNEINLVHNEIRSVHSLSHRALLFVILSRVMRSCRATTHSDLATLKDPVVAPYYCRKHGKICKPLFSILRWWIAYSKDTMKRIGEFRILRTNTHQLCLTGDSRDIDIQKRLSSANPVFGELLQKKKIQGIFSSPPYVGMIDYHEQHAYAYELFGIDRNDESEIGPQFRGHGQKARDSYIDGISNVLINSKRFLVDDFDIFIVANDKYNLYPQITDMAGMKIVEMFTRPVINRTERDKGVYSETIFHLKDG